MDRQTDGQTVRWTDRVSLCLGAMTMITITLSIMALSIRPNCKCYLLNVTELSVVVLSIVIHSIIKLSGVMLSVILPSIVMPRVL
jgi:hypothetical protein